MHIQEVFQAIYEKHLYEYFIIDSNLKIITYSDEISKYCDIDIFDLGRNDIFVAVPELVGMRDELLTIFDGSCSDIVLPTIAKATDIYVDLTICRGKPAFENEQQYTTAIVLFEDVTDKTVAHQNSLQDRNEKVILAKELEKKNLQLERFNIDMYNLVQEEIIKNRENQKIIKLQARHAQMGEIIGMITHQWKQPLNIINMACGFLQMRFNRGKLDKELFDRKIANVLNQSSHLNQTILDFQNFFNPATKMERFIIYDTLNNMLNLVKSDYVMKNISITLEGCKNTQIDGYPNEFSQAILSLLQNSRDAFMNIPHEDMRIDITIANKDGTATVTVKDNAGGIPADILPKIFDVYITTKKDGSGLGLHIVKSIIEEKMNGELQVINIPGGVKFVISIPIQPAQPTQ